MMEYAIDVLRADTKNPYVDATSSMVKFGAAAALTALALSRLPKTSLIPAAVAVTNATPVALFHAKEKKRLSQGVEKVFTPVSKRISELYEMGLFLAFSEGVSAASLGFAFRSTFHTFQSNASMWQRAGSFAAVGTGALLSYSLGKLAWNHYPGND